MDIPGANNLQKYSYTTYYRGNEIDSAEPLLNNNSINANTASSTNFSKLPTELVEMILNSIPKLYSPEESVCQLSVLMQANKMLLSLAEKIRGKVFIYEFEKLFIDSTDINLKSAEEQMNWCKEAISKIVRKPEFSRSQIQFYIGCIISKVQYIWIDFYFPRLDSGKSNEIIDIIFHCLLKKTNIKILDLHTNLPHSSNYDRYKFTSNFVLILNQNPGLSRIPHLDIESDSLDAELMQSLLASLSDKVIPSFTLQMVPNFTSGIDKYKGPELKTFSRYLKRIKIKNLTVKVGDIKNEDILRLIGNLPTYLDSLSLGINLIHHDGANLLFNSLKHTEIQYLTLECYDLKSFKAKDVKSISNFLALKKVNLNNTAPKDEVVKLYDIKNKYGEEIEFSY